MKQAAIQMEKSLMVYHVKVESKRSGKMQFLLLRTDSDGLLTMPRGFRLVYVGGDLTTFTKK
jgi:hypothetical protein